MKANLFRPFYAIVIAVVLVFQGCKNAPNLPEPIPSARGNIPPAPAGRQPAGIVKLPLSRIPFAIHELGAPEPGVELVQVDLFLEDQNSRFENLVEFEIWIEMKEAFPAGGSFFLSMEYSWVVSQGDYTAELFITPDQKFFTVVFRDKIGQPRSGQGVVASIYLEVPVGMLDFSRLIEGGGGHVMIDNLDAI